MKEKLVVLTLLVLSLSSSALAVTVRWIGNGHLYDVILVPEGITWTNANVAAQARGSGWHLATITSAEENAFVANLASNPVFWSVAAGPWLGGFKVGPRVGDYAWVTGEPFVYTNWGPREPFGNGDRLALFGYHAPTGSTWNDVRAVALARAYIIETEKLTIVTRALPPVKLEDTASYQLEAQLGTPPYSWSLSDGTLPPGMNLSTTGLLSGTPTEPGSFPFTVHVRDDNGDTIEKSLTQDVVLIPPPPNIRINKTGTVAVPGRTLDYFIVVENVGNVTWSELSQPLLDCAIIS